MIRLRAAVRHPCHSERGEESRSGSFFCPELYPAALRTRPGERRARFLAPLGMTSAQGRLKALADA